MTDDTDEHERASKKSRRDAHVARAPPTAPEAPPLADTLQAAFSASITSHPQRPSARVVQQILAELIQQLRACNADTVQTTKLLGVYQLFLNAFDDNGKIHLGVLQCAIERKSLVVVQYLVESGADLELAGPHGLPPPLALACMLGQLEMAKYLVSRGADVNAASSTMARNRTPLYLAASAGHYEILLWLVESGAKVNEEESSSGRTPLFAAAAGGHLRIMKFLLSKGANTTCGSWRGENLRYVAAAAGQRRILEYLMENGIGKADSPGQIANCLEAAVHAEQADTVRFVLDKGEFTRKQASDCLPMAIKFMNSEIAHLLISHGALKTASEGILQMSLAIAIAGRMTDIVELLVRGGASFTQEIMPTQPTALHMMAKAGSVPMLQMMERIGRTQEVDFNIMSEGNGFTPFQVAAFHGQMDALQFLLTVVPASFDLNSETTCKNTALTAAAESGHVEIVKLLLAKGAVIQREGGSSALYRAAAEGHLEIVQLLCEHGAMINYLGGGNLSVLHIAVRNRHLEVAEYLLETWGADASTVADDGWTALDYSVFHIETLQVFLAHGTYREIYFQASSRTLCHAILRSRMVAASMLINHGADVNAEYIANEDEWPLAFTPLILAAISGKYEIVALLGLNDADVEGRTDAGETALMFAAAKGYLSIVEYLVEDLDADVNATSDFQFTAVDLAKRHGQDMVVQYLLANGADPPEREMLAYKAFEERFELSAEKFSKLEEEHENGIEYWERQGIYDDYLDEFELLW